jgi:hypothetical protein
MTVTKILELLGVAIMMGGGPAAPARHSRRSANSKQR